MGDQIQAGGETPHRQDLLVAALSTPCNEATFQQCLAQLPDYIEAQLAGEDVLARFPETAVLLDACSDCAAAYAHFYEVAVAVASDQLPEPTRAGKPDLTFLQTNPLLSRLQTAITQLVDGLALQLSSDLVSLLTPPPILAQVRARQDETRYSDVILQLDEQDVPDMAFPILLKAYRDSQQPTDCLVEVTVLPEDLEDVVTHEVTLRLGERVETAVTDWGGVADFEQIPIAALSTLKIEVSKVG